MTRVKRDRQMALVQPVFYKEGRREGKEGTIAVCVCRVCERIERELEAEEEGKLIGVLKGLALVC